MTQIDNKLGLLEDDTDFNWSIWATVFRFSLSKLISISGEEIIV